MAKCLITGHMGFIGSKLFKALESLGHEVEGIDLKEPAGINAIESMTIYSNRPIPYWRDFQPEYIFHMACWPSVQQCNDDPLKTLRNNVILGSTVLNFAKFSPSVKRVIYSSSCSVIGNGSGPTNFYALHKMTTEIETRLYADIFNLDTVSLRYQNVYSEDQDASGPYASVIAHWRHCVKNNKTPYITGDGTQTRDMIHVDDIVAANIFAMEHPHDFKGAVLNVGTGTTISLNEIKDKILKHCKNLRFDYVKERSGDVYKVKSDSSIINNLGWHAKIDIDEGIRRCFAKETK